MLKWWCCRTGWSRDSRRRRKKVCNWVKVSSPTSQHIVKNLYRSVHKLAINAPATAILVVGNWLNFVQICCSINSTDISHTAYIEKCVQYCSSLRWRDKYEHKHLRLWAQYVGRSFNLKQSLYKQFYVST